MFITFNTAVQKHFWCWQFPYQAQNVPAKQHFYGASRHVYTAQKIVGVIRVSYLVFMNLFWKPAILLSCGVSRSRDVSFLLVVFLRVKSQTLYPPYFMQDHFRELHCHARWVGMLFDSDSRLEFKKDWFSELTHFFSILFVGDNSVLNIFSFCVCPYLGSAS